MQNTTAEYNAMHSREGFAFKVATFLFVVWHTTYNTDLEDIKHTMNN